MHHWDVVTPGFTTYCMLCFHLEMEKIKTETQIQNYSAHNFFRGTEKLDELKFILFV